MWWSEDEYKKEEVIPDSFPQHAGPYGVAMVREHRNGKTDPGWGLSTRPGKGFMENYVKRQFTPDGYLFGYRRGMWGLAFVMRSLRMVCIDIDGKNGGLEHAGRLGMLPLTLAETSRSGNGYHLFYVTSEDAWDATTGFAAFKDRIGIQQGVDVRATGCVFHWPGQRWNGREPVELPQHLKEMLRAHSQQASATVAQIAKVLDTQDEQEIAVMRDSMIDDLAKPIQAGRRNNTLFAIGSQLMLAQVPDWRQLVEQRAIDVGLGVEEIDKLLRNIAKYGANA